MNHASAPQADHSGGHEHGFAFTMSEGNGPEHRVEVDFDGLDITYTVHDADDTQAPSVEQGGRR
ncbi:hypothetical protein [Glycomyces salinus]|uniref:hypothetical protein n=1 Tax=Glycomyces salinus TaxID=980294 RepID=UPI0018EDFCF3|nr:hypothetical protein [Glycomyces salinus]